MKINGFSNLYFDWGAEDDDLRSRTEAVFKSFKKRPADINRYFMGGHVHQKINKDRKKMLIEAEKKIFNKEIDEGLSTVKYEVKRIVKNMLYTLYVVDHPNSPY